MGRSIRMSLGGHDLAGITMWNPGSAAFFTLDDHFSIHSTAHDPAPKRGFPQGTVHLATEVPSKEDDPAATIFFAPPAESWDHPLAELRNPIHIGTALIPGDLENLALFSPSKSKHSRFTLPDRWIGKTVAISGWLMPPNHYYVLPMAAADAVAYAIESTGSPWLVLSISVSDP